MDPNSFMYATLVQLAFTRGSYHKLTSLLRMIMSYAAVQKDSRYI